MADVLNPRQLRTAEMDAHADTLRELSYTLQETVREYDQLYGGSPDSAVQGNLYNTDYDYVYESYDEGLTELLDDPRLRNLADTVRQLRVRSRHLMLTSHRHS